MSFSHTHEDVNVFSILQQRLEFDSYVVYLNHWLNQVNTERTESGYCMHSGDIESAQYNVVGGIIPQACSCLCICCNTLFLLLAPLLPCSQPPPTHPNLNIQVTTQLFLVDPLLFDLSVGGLCRTIAAAPSFTGRRDLCQGTDHKQICTIQHLGPFWSYNTPDTMPST